MHYCSTRVEVRRQLGRVWVFSFCLYTGGRDQMQAVRLPGQVHLLSGVAGSWEASPVILTLTGQGKATSHT